jgi:hypothetical protein
MHACMCIYVWIHVCTGIFVLSAHAVNDNAGTFELDALVYMLRYYRAFADRREVFDEEIVSPRTRCV